MINLLERTDLARPKQLLEDEVERRTQKQLGMRLRRAGLNPTKTLEGFDFDFNPSINRQQILHLAEGDFVREHRNVILCGPTGTGKSHLAQALGHEACRKGYQALLVDTDKMLKHLNGGRDDDGRSLASGVYIYRLMSEGNIQTRKLVLVQ